MFALLKRNTLAMVYTYVFIVYLVSSILNQTNCSEL